MKYDLSILIPARSELYYSKVMTFQKGHTIFKGRKHSQATKDKISKANKGRVFSEEWRKNLSEAHKGQKSWRKGKIFVPIEVQKQRREIYLKKWKAENRELLREQDRAWKLKNRDKVNEQVRARYKKNRDVLLAKRRQKIYGINLEEYDIVNNKGICPVCSRESEKNLSVDHDHSTGRVRGFICNNCNVALGRVADSPSTLRALADYLDGKK